MKDDAAGSLPRRRVLLWALIAVVVVAYAQLRVSRTGPGYTGGMLVLTHLFDLALVAGLLAVCGSVGGRLLRWWGEPPSPAPPDRLLLSILVGAGIVATAFLAVGLLGLLSLWSAAGVLALAGWWGRMEFGPVLDDLSVTLRRVPRSVWLVTGLVGIALLLRGLAPPTDWDSLMYHLHLPQQFLEAGEIFRPRDTLHVAFVGLAHMLYLPLLALGGSSTPVILSLAFGLLLPLAVYRLARRIAGPTSAEVAGVAIWGTTAVALVAVTARVDVTLILFLTGAHTALYDALAGDGDQGHLLLAAVLLGAAVGVKYQAGAYVLALSPLVAWAALEGGPSAGRLRWNGLALLVGAGAVVALPWFAKNGFLLDAPFYPFLAERLLPTWLAELHGSRLVPDVVDPAIFGALGEVRRPFDLVDAFLHPERLSPEGEAAHYHLSPLLLLLPAWVAWFRDRDLAWVMAPGLGYVALVLAVSPKTNLRYLLPAIPPLTVAASVLAVRIVRWGRDRVKAVAGEDDEGRYGAAASPGRSIGVRVAALGLAAASLVPTAAGLSQWLPGEVSLAHLAGTQSRTAYLSQRRNPAMVTRAGLTDFGERPMPEDARVLMLFEAREHYFDVPAVQDPLLTNWSLLAPIRGRLKCLRAADVTHVLVGTGVLEYYFRRGLEPETVGWPSFRDFARRCLVTTLEVPGFRFFSVRQDPGSGGGDGRSPGVGPESPAEPSGR